MSHHSPPRFLKRTSPPHIFTLIFLTGLSALTMNIFLPSLPAMADYFDADYRIIQLAVAVYLLVMAGLQILIGPISDNIGRRPVLLWGICLFALATLGCIMARSVEVFLFFRMSQAVVAVALVLSRASVRDIFPADKAASMIGYVTAGMAVVPMISPAIGGVLGEAFGWQSTFWLMFALALVAFALTWLDFGETAVASGLTLTQQFRQYGELLKSPRFWGYSLASATTSGTFFAYLGGAPFVGSHVFGLDSATLGFYFGVPAIGYFIGNVVSGRFATHFGINKMVFWGCTLNTLGAGLSLLLFIVGIGGVNSFFGLMALVGIGNGMALPSATSGSMSVRPHLAGSASGLAGSIMLGGGAALSAIAGMMLTIETGPNPLLWIMFLTAAASVVFIALVVLRERRLTM